MLTYSSMLRFCGQFFIKSEAKLDVLRMQILVVNNYKFLNPLRCLPPTFACLNISKNGSCRHGLDRCSLHVMLIFVHSLDVFLPKDVPHSRTVLLHVPLRSDQGHLATRIAGALANAAASSLLPCQILSQEHATIQVLNIVPGLN